MNVSKKILLVSTILLLGACAMKPDNLQLVTRPGGSGGGNSPPGDPTKVEFAAVNLLHANNILPSLGLITGVTNYAANTTIINAENQYRTALSPTGNPGGFTPQMALGNLALVTGFCREAATRELNLADAQRIMYPGVVINAAMPAGGFSDATLQKIVSNAWSRFRGEDVVPSDVMPMVVTSLKNIYSNLPATSANANTLASKANALGARSIAESGCIIVGASWASISNPI